MGEYLLGSRMKVFGKKILIRGMAEFPVMIFCKVAYLSGVLRINMDILRLQ